MLNDILVTRTGRKLEVKEYGDNAGHPVLFFHGLIGSHHQASYVADQARESGLRIIAPNRPGVGRSEFTERQTALETVSDVEDIVSAFGLDDFSVIGLSGGTPYALAALYRLAPRIRTASVISGMGPMRLPGALHGMHHAKRVVLEIGSRYPQLANRFFQKSLDRFRAGSDRFLDYLIQTWSRPDRTLFQRKEIRDLFMKDLHEVFTAGKGPESLAQELTIYRNYGFSLRDLPLNKRVTLWQGLNDNIVSPAMAWEMTRSLPNCEAHFVPGGHFVAIVIADQIISRLRQLLYDRSADPAAVARTRP